MRPISEGVHDGYVVLVLDPEEARYIAYLMPDHDNARKDILRWADEAEGDE